MRLARSNDIWRKLFRAKKRPLESIELQYREAPESPELSLSIKAPIVLLCGENGVGKSQALRALQTACGGKFSPIDFRPLAGPKPSHVESVRATFRKKGGAEYGDPLEVNGIDEIAAQLRDESNDSRIFNFDPTLQIPYLLHLLRHDSSLPDLWEGVSPKKLSKEELEDVSALVGRTYSEVDFYEISDYQHHEVVPYFRVKCNTETYGAEDMGLGELSLLFFYWTLSRLAPGSLLLLEEPETFVAPKSQRYMVDLLAESAVDREIVAVISSHSGIIAERIPGTHIHYVSREGRTVTFMSNPARNILADRLALVPPKSIVALLEDEAGVMLTRALLEAGNSKYLSHCTLLIAGSESEITSTLKGLTPTSTKGNATLVGLYDGDQRGKIPQNDWWPTLSLPGDEAPEHMVKEWLSSNRPNLPQLLGRDAASVSTAISSVDGQNHHDWLTGFSDLLQISLQELFRRVAKGLHETQAHQVQSFIAEFDRKCSGIQAA